MGVAIAPVWSFVVQSWTRGFGFILVSFATFKITFLNMLFPLGAFGFVSVRFWVFNSDWFFLARYPLWTFPTQFISNLLFWKMHVDDASLQTKSAIALATILANTFFLLWITILDSMLGNYKDLSICGYWTLFPREFFLTFVDGIPF